MTEFLPLCDVLFNVISLAGYFCDVVFDVIFGYALFERGQFAYFSIVIALVLLSLFATQIVSFIWYTRQEKLIRINQLAISNTNDDGGVNKYNNNNNNNNVTTASTAINHQNTEGSQHQLGAAIIQQPSSSWDIKNNFKRYCIIALHCSQMGVLWRYAKLFIPVDLRHVKHEVRDLCMLRLVHAFCEAAPMLLLQLYILVTIQIDDHHHNSMNFETSLPFKVLLTGTKAIIIGGGGGMDGNGGGSDGSDHVHYLQTTTPVTTTGNVNNNNNPKLLIDNKNLPILSTIVQQHQLRTFKDLNIVSATLSLFSVCWALASFSKNVRLQNVHRLVLTWLGVIFQFFWRLGTITARMIALTMYASVYNYWIFLVIILHWLSMFFWLISPKNVFHGERISRTRKTVLAGMIAFVYIFAYINLQEVNHRQKMLTFYVVMFLENLLLIGLWLAGIWSDNNSVSPHHGGGGGGGLWYMPFIVISSFFIGIGFMLLYYRYFHVRRLEYESGGRLPNNFPSKYNQHHIINGNSTCSGGVTICDTNNNSNNNNNIANPKYPLHAIPGVFNCRFSNPVGIGGTKRKKKKPTTFIPPPISPAASNYNNIQSSAITLEGTNHNVDELAARGHLNYSSQLLLHRGGGGGQHQSQQQQQQQQQQQTNQQSQQHQQQIHDYGGGNGIEHHQQQNINGMMSIPFWRRPLPHSHNGGSSENEGSVSSRVDIQLKLQEKKLKQLADLKIIEEEIKQGKLCGPIMNHNRFGGGGRSIAGRSIAGGSAVDGSIGMNGSGTETDYYDDDGYHQDIRQPIPREKKHINLESLDWCSQILLQNHIDLSLAQLTAAIPPTCNMPSMPMATTSSITTAAAAVAAASTTINSNSSTMIPSSTAIALSSTSSPHTTLAGGMGKSHGIGKNLMAENFDEQKMFNDLNKGIPNHNGIIIDDIRSNYNQFNLPESVPVQSQPPSSSSSSVAIHQRSSSVNCNESIHNNNNDMVVMTGMNNMKTNLLNGNNGGGGGNDILSRISLAASPPLHHHHHHHHLHSGMVVMPSSSSSVSSVSPSAMQLLQDKSNINESNNNSPSIAKMMMMQKHNNKNVIQQYNIDNNNNNNNNINGNVDYCNDIDRINNDRSNNKINYNSNNKIINNNNIKNDMIHHHHHHHLRQHSNTSNQSSLTDDNSSNNIEKLQFTSNGITTSTTTTTTLPPTALPRNTNQINKLDNRLAVIGASPPPSLPIKPLNNIDNLISEGGKNKLSHKLQLQHQGNKQQQPSQLLNDNKTPELLLAPHYLDNSKMYYNWMAAKSAIYNSQLTNFDKQNFNYNISGNLNNNNNSNNNVVIQNNNTNNQNINNRQSIVSSSDENLDEHDFENGNNGGAASDIDSQISLPRSYTLPREFKYYRRNKARRLIKNEHFITSTNSSDGDVDSADDNDDENHTNLSVNQLNKNGPHQFYQQNGDSASASISPPTPTILSSSNNINNTNSYNNNNIAAIVSSSSVINNQLNYNNYVNYPINNMMNGHSVGVGGGVSNGVIDPISDDNGDNKIINNLNIIDGVLLTTNDNNKQTNINKTKINNNNNNNNLNSNYAAMHRQLRLRVYGNGKGGMVRHETRL